MSAARSKIPFWFADQIPGYVPDPESTCRIRERVRRQELAKRFKVNERTIDYWWRVTGFLPPPHYLGDHQSKETAA
jgi:hypothetical protein